MIGRGAVVLVVLHSPREKVWGVLDEVGAAGVFLRGIDLNGLEDWARAVASGEQFGGPAHLFFPMWRVERVELDERQGDVPSLAEQFAARAGRRPEDCF